MTFRQSSPTRRMPSSRAFIFGWSFPCQGWLSPICVTRSIFHSCLLTHSPGLCPSHRFCRGLRLKYPTNISKHLSLNRSSRVLLIVIEYHQLNLLVSYHIGQALSGKKCQILTIHHGESEIGRHVYISTSTYRS
jgi:hypothetical protein